MSDNHLYETSDQLVPRCAKEELLKQRGLVVWLYGLSGSGKTSLAAALEHRLHDQGRQTVVLDGDNVRSGLNKGIGFSVEDRMENIRRAAEVAKLFVSTGIVTICSFITPAIAMRSLARDIIGDRDFLEIYVACSFEECARRDVKGLYAKVKDGKVAQFTGKDSQFEPPVAVDMMIDTETESFDESLARLHATVTERITLK